MRRLVLIFLLLIARDLARTQGTGPVSVTLDSPAAGSTLSGEILLSASASSSAAPIVKVEYYLDGVLIATVTNPITPPSLSLTVLTQ